MLEKKVTKVIIENKNVFLMLLSGFLSLIKKLGKEI